MLDYDGKVGGFVKNFTRIKNVLEIDSFIKIIAVKIHQTGKGFHMRINLTSPVKLSNSRIINLQLLFKSDWKREAFNFLRDCSNCSENWNLLYNQKFRYVNGKKVMLSKELPRTDLESLFMKKLNEVKI